MLSIEQVIGDAVTDVARRLVRIEVATVSAVAKPPGTKLITLMYRGGTVRSSKLASYTTPVVGDKVLVVVLRQGMFVVLGKIG